MRKHLISGWCRHISTEGCKHARTQCLNQQKPLLSFKKHKNTEVQNSENTAAANNKKHSLRCLRAWKKLFWVLKKHRETCDTRWGYSFDFFRSNYNKTGTILVQISIKLHTIAESSLHCDLVVAPRLRMGSFGQRESRGMKMRLFAVLLFYNSNLFTLFSNLDKIVATMKMVIRIFFCFGSLAKRK